MALPEPFFGVAACCVDLSQTMDNELHRLLEPTRDQVPKVRDWVGLTKLASRLEAARSVVLGAGG